MECAQLQIGSGVELYGIPFHLCRSMSATVFVYTREGFAISADGRCTLLDGTVFSDEQVKIFPAAAPRITSAYALTGQIGSAFHDLTVQAGKIVTALSAVSISGGYEYANALARGLKRYLGECIRDGVIDALSLATRPGLDGFARLVMVGYYDEEPFFCTINLAHSQEGKTLLRPVSHPVVPGTAALEGSNRILALIKSRDPRVWDRATMDRIPEDALEQGVCFTRALIAAQCNQVANALDPDRCGRIGGHVHTATVTPDGFRWITPPKDSAPG
jgi:hypothetical protein